MKKIIYSAGLAVSLLNACGQAPQDEDPSGAVSSSAALAMLGDCITESKTCAGAAMSGVDVRGCADKLRACIAPFIAKVGSIRGLDGGFPQISIPVFPGLPTFPTFPGVPGAPGAGAPGVPGFPGFDGGLPPVAGGEKVRACVTALNACLAGNTDPKTCATQAQTCIASAR